MDNSADDKLALNEFSSKESLKRYMSFTFTLCVGVFISIIAFISVLNSNMESLKDKFFYESNLKTENLKTRFFGYERDMELLEGFFESSDKVTEVEFNNYVRPLFDKADFSNILWIDGASRGQNSYRVSLSATKKGYNSLSEFNNAMDVAVYPEILSSILYVIREGRPSLSDNLKFLSDTPHNVAFVYPVLKGGQNTGIVIGILDIEKVFEKSLMMDDGLVYKNLNIYNKEDLIFNSNDLGKQFSSSGNRAIQIRDLAKRSAFYYHGNVRIFSEKWDIIFTPTNKYIAMATNWYPWLILILGVTLTSILGMFLFSLIGRNIQTERSIRIATEELENNKQHIEAILNTVMEGIITIDIKGIVQTFNPAAEQMFGYKSDEVIGRNVNMLMPSGNKKHHDEYINNYLETGKAKIIGIGREVEAKRKDGSKFPMSLGITQTILKGEKIFVGVVRDVTKEKAYKIKLEEYNQRLEEAWADANKANKSKSEFLATMSHEIRTPMNGIIGMAELLSYSELTKQQEKYLKTIQSSGDLLLVLINDILDFSKIEAGELELENIPVVINALLSEVAQLLSGRARDNNVEIAVRNTQDVPVAIWGDPVRLRQVLINLVGNAVKFSKNGYVLINVEVLGKYEDEVDLRFEVRDTGIGIAKDKIDTIFEQFTQADSSTTREFGGTGLGLAICQKLINLMGGQIGVESEVGKGSVFWFEITSKIQSNYTESNIDVTRDLKDVRILIVDDYPINLEIFSEYLRKVGIGCDVASGGKEALAMLRKDKVAGKPYDVALIDYDMPDINGEVVGKMISENSEEFGSPKLVLFTALDKTSHTDFLDSSGYVEKLLKPVYPSTLINTILKVLDKKNSKHNKEVVKGWYDDKSLPSYNCNVLIVEDFEPNRDVAQAILEKLGCSVSIVDDGQEAIKVLQKNSEKYDLVFIDCQMPNMDGYKATKEIRKNKWGKDIMIYALTASAQTGDKKKCIAAGMNGYLSKPVKIEDIQQVLEKILKDKAA